MHIGSADSLRVIRYMTKVFGRLSFIAALIGFTAVSVPVQAKEAENLELEPASSFAGSFLAGTAAIQDFDYAAAAFYFRDALDYDPENAELQRELMIAHLNNGEFEKALPLAEKLQDVASVQRVSRFVTGVDAIIDGRNNEARSMLTLTEQNDIERLLSGIMRGWAHFAEGNIGDALETIDTLNGPDWYNLFQAYHGALIAEAAGNRDDVKRRYEDAINDATGGSASPLTYLRLAEAFAGYLARNGEVTEAKEVVSRGLGIAPNNPILVDLADTISPSSNTLRVEDAAKGAAEILLNVGSAINRQGAETFATIYLELSRAANPTEAQTLFELGTIADRLELTEKAIALYAAVSETSPLHRPAALQQGLALSSLDRNDEAIETLTALVDESPEDYSGYMALGGVLASEKRYEEAIGIYTTAFKYLDRNDSRFWPLHYRLGIAFERTKQWPKAEETFKHTLTLSPDQPDVLNYLGYSWIDMNMNLEEGVEMIEKAVEMRPRDGYIVDSLGWAHYRLGRFEDAVEVLERATDLRPRDPTINDHLGDAYWRVGRKLEAAFQWSQVLDMDGEDVNKDNVRAKLEAANSGEAPVVAGSIVDDKSGDAQAISDGTQKPKTETNGG